jgi:hypothetical protein
MDADETQIFWLAGGVTGMTTLKYCSAENSPAL